MQHACGESKLRRVQDSIAYVECVACWTRALAGLFFIVAAAFAIVIFIATEVNSIMNGSIVPICEVLTAAGTATMSILWMVEKNVTRYRAYEIDIRHEVAYARRISEEKRRRQERRDRAFAAQPANSKVLWARQTAAAA